MATLWFSPVCDMVLAKLEWWAKNYELGVVSATCQFHDPVEGVVDKPTRYAHKMLWTVLEMEHLAQMVEALSTNKPLIEEVQLLSQVTKKARMVSGGLRQITLNFYPEHLREILQTVREAKLGKAKSLSDFMAEDGKLF